MTLASMLAVAFTLFVVRAFCAVKTGTKYVCGTIENEPIECVCLRHEVHDD